VAALEVDAGAGRPLGVTGAADRETQALLSELVRPLGAIHAAKVSQGEEAGADLRPMVRAGHVPAVTVVQDVSSYFDWHHTAADTLDKIDPDDLKRVLVAVAVLTSGLANTPRLLPRAVAHP
jgi:hypothetical protein